MDSSELKIHAPEGDTLKVLRCLSDKPKSLRDIQRETRITYFQLPGMAAALLDFGLATRAGIHGRDWTVSPLGLDAVAQYHEDKRTMIEFQIPGAAWDFYVESPSTRVIPTFVRRISYGNGYAIVLKATWSDAKWLADQMGCDGQVQSDSGMKAKHRVTGQALLTAQQRILDAMKVCK